MTTLHERALVLARSIAAESLCRGEAWLPGTKAGIHKEILDGRHDSEPLVQGPFNAILRTTELATELADVGRWNRVYCASPESIATALRSGAHLTKAPNHD